MEIALHAAILVLIILATSMVVIYMMGTLDLRRLNRELKGIIEQQKGEFKKLADLHNSTQMVMPNIEARLESLEFKLSQIPAAKPFGR